MSTTNSPLAQVFEPIAIGNVTVKNRIARTAHGTGLSTDGKVSDRLIAYHVARAEGGVGLTFVEATGVHPLYPYMINATHDGVIEGLKRLTDAVRPYGMKLFQQLWGGTGPNSIWMKKQPPPLSASAVTTPGMGGWMPKPMTKQLIDEHVQGYAAAAVRCREGGLDGVEVHSAHGYLIGSFLSPITNIRTDEYGGSPENRMRFLTEILVAVRAAVGADFPVGMRISGDDGVEGGLTPRDVSAIIDTLTAQGLLDFVDITNGTYFRAERIFGTAIAKHGYEMPFSAPIAEKATVPTIVTGRFLTLAEAEKVIVAGQADLVSMVRAHIAEPAIVRKTAEGRINEIRPCIGCIQGCLGQQGGGIGCAVNPGAGQELHIGDGNFAAAQTALDVLVAGGGPAGLEAARVAAESGHRVQLFEAADELGGQLRFTRNSAKRSDTAAVIGYWEAELARLGVDVHVGATVDAELVRAIAPDIVMVATGARPANDGILIWHPGHPVTGWGSLPSLTSWDVLSGQPAGPSVVVYDDYGQYEAIDVVDRLLADGATVHYATRFSRIGDRMDGDPWLWEVAVRPHQREMMANPAFTAHPNVVVEAITSDSVTFVSLDTADRVETVSADSIVIVASRPVNRLTEDLASVSAEIVTIGDADGIRTLEAAVYDAHVAARAIGATTRKVAAR